MYRSLEVLRKGAWMAKVLEEPVIDLYSLGDFRKGLPPPHFPKEPSLVLVKARGIMEVPAIRDEGKPKGNIRILIREFG